VCEANCFGDQQKVCPVQDCQTPFYAGAVNKVSNFLGNAIDGFADTTSSKVQAIVGLIEGISQTAKDDQIVVFVQYKKVRHQVIRALDRNGISSVGGRDGSSIENDIVAFRQSKARVLVLKLTGIEAAGINLHNANHVIFTSPLIEADDHDFDVLLRQAKGRCLRYGQEKAVRVYHFQSLFTVEEDVVKKHLSHAQIPPGAETLVAIKQLCEDLSVDVKNRPTKSDSDIQKVKDLADCDAELQKTLENSGANDDGEEDDGEHLEMF
jgi:superfamily II DNA or RNA helicase